MPDWKELVREKAGKLHLSVELRDEIIHELAAHLEDSYEQLRASGLSEARAMEMVWSQNPGWQQMMKKIERAKRKEGIMNSRTKQLWLPAFICLVTSMLLMMAFEIIGAKFYMPWTHATWAWVPYAVWIITLPVIGAITGFLSRRAGSTRATRVLVALFPPIVVTLICLFLLGLVIAHGLPVYILGLSFVLSRMVLIPGIALLAGSLPFMRPGQSCTQAHCKT